MASGYPFKDIEQKWQDFWLKEGTYRAEDRPAAEKANKFFGLVEFPYPSGDGLHVGHPRSYTAIDIMSRKKRMEGKDVLYPMGWDAFGLPTENYAIKNKVKPVDATKKNIANFKRQLQSLGFGFDWSREINTTDPRYYKWTQWMFLQFYNAYFDEVEGRALPIDELAIPASVTAKGEEAVREYRDSHRMVYKAETTINWCPKDKIGLANEEAQGGICERCGTPVEQRLKSQWMIRITKYADRLLRGLDTVDYLERIRAQQVNWIGKSEGALIDFGVKSEKSGDLADEVTVFTTRPDTLFGATYLVLAPEHALVSSWIKDGDVENAEVINAYREETKRKSDLQRQDTKDKTGVELKGVKARNPANGELIPIWISDYVLASYGTGSIMAVPAHDERDFAFAKKFDLPVRIVVEPVTGEKREDEEFRRSIVAIVKDPRTGKFLSINWGKDKGGNLFIGGGLEEGEDPIACAVREIEEETGYSNVSFVAVSEKVHHHYFAASKNVARQIEAVGLYFELADDKKGEPDLEPDEQGKFAVEWLSESEAEKRVADPLHAYLFRKFVKGECYGDEGIATASDFLNGLTTEAAKERMIAWLEQQGIGERKMTYKLRDWVFSRQRYWGEPIPMVHCVKCGYVPVPTEQLPVTLPEVANYEPTDTGESPLAAIRDWVEVSCSSCGGKAERETDTMPNWAGSSWYFLRYCDPQNDATFADREKLKYWMPVDLYNGGMEHTTLHLLYSRFWHKVLFDLGHIPHECGDEPYGKRRSHAMILGEGGVKMSKSKGNVVNPDDVVNEYGADTFRTYEMFIGPFDADAPWDTHGIEGVKRFLEKIWKLSDNVKDGAAISGEAEALLHQTIKKVGEDIEAMRFNTAVSAMMILVNEFSSTEISREVMEKLLKILAPFAPHLAEELWSKLGNKASIHRETWPTYDPKKIVASTFELVIQVNGKVRDKITVDANISEEEAKNAALASEKVKAILGEKAPQKVVYVKGRLLSIVA